MPKFVTLEGEELEYGIPGEYALKDEQAFILSFEKQLRRLNPKNSNHTDVLRRNANTLLRNLGVDELPMAPGYDTDLANVITYFDKNKRIFMKHGITNHMKAKEIEKTTAHIDKPHEYAPTIDEMKALDIDISELYEDSRQKEGY